MQKTVHARAFRAATGREMEVSYFRLQGRRPGPTLTLIGGQHGTENIGPVVLTRFLSVCPETFRGTLYVCPCANPFAMDLDYEYHREPDGPDPVKEYYSKIKHDFSITYLMNRYWNRRGQPGFGVSGEISTWLWDAACAEADVVIDFHCRNGDRPLIYAAGEKVLPVARYFGAQGVYMSLGGVDPDSFGGGNLSIQANLGNCIAFCVEFSQQHGYKRGEIPFGLNGIINVMRGIGMLEEPAVLDRPVYRIRKSVPVPAEATGHIYYHREPYDPVSKGDVLFEVLGLETSGVLHRGVAPMDGVMGEPTRKPIAAPGLDLCLVHQVDILAEAGRALPKVRLDGVKPGRRQLK